MKFQIPILIILLTLGIQAPSFAQVQAEGVNIQQLEVISEESNGSSIEPALAIDRAGNWHYVWMDYFNLSNAGTDFDIFYRMYNVTSGEMGDIKVISENSNQSSYEPHIVINSKGFVEIVWRDVDDLAGSGTDSDIFFREYYPANDTLSEIEVVSSTSDDSSAFLDIVIDSDDNLHVVWADYDDFLLSSGTDTDIFYRMRSADGSWSSLALISDTSTGFSGNPAITLGANNDLFVAWNDNTDYDSAGVDYDIFFRRYANSGSSWSTVEVISTESTSASYDPSLKVDSSGNIHLVWRDNTDYNGASSDFDIFYKVYSSNLNVWTSTIVLVDSSSSSVYTPKIVINSYDDIFITYLDNSDDLDAGTDEDVFLLSRRSSEGTWSKSLVSSESTNEVAYHALTLDLDGNLRSIYSVDDDFGSGTDYDIFIKSIILTPDSTQLVRSSDLESGSVELSWNAAKYSTGYFIYRDSEPIYNITGMDPVNITTSTSFSEVLEDPGVYFYAVVSTNNGINSSISNSVVVTLGLTVTTEIENTDTTSPESSFPIPPDLAFYSGAVLALVGVLFFALSRRK